MMTPSELEEKIKGMGTAEALFEAFKHQNKQLARLAFLSFELLDALDANDLQRVDVMREVLGKYMLIETNLALKYGDKP